MLLAEDYYMHDLLLQVLNPGQDFAFSLVHSHGMHVADYYKKNDK